MNNREKATVIWLAIALAAGLRQHEIRKALWEVLKCFAQPKIVGPVLAFAGWTVGLVVLAHLVGLWESDVRNDTVLWFITVGIAILFSLREVSEDGFVRKTARRALAVTAFVEGFVNLEVFGLAVELVLLPVLVLLGTLAVVSESKEEYAPIRSLVSGLLAVFGVCAVLYVAGRLTAEFDAGHTLRVLALPVWLTIGNPDSGPNRTRKRSELTCSVFRRSKSRSRGLCGAASGRTTWQGAHVSWAREHHVRVIDWGNDCVA